MSENEILFTGLYFMVGFLFFRIEVTRNLVLRLDSAALSNDLDLHREIKELRIKLNQLAETSSKHSGML